MDAILHIHFQIHFLNENCCILIQILLKFIPKGQIHKMANIGSNNGLAPNSFLNQWWHSLLTQLSMSLPQCV